MTANAYFIPAGADFDPYAPTLQDLGRAINISKAFTHMDFTHRTPKEHSMVVAAFGNTAAEAATNVLSQFHTLPKAVPGKSLKGYDTKPWLAHVGGLSISHTTDPARHIELALEHLVAAQTVPTLQAAWDSQVEVQAEAARKQFTDRLHSESMLNVLSGYNEAWLNSNPCASWREMQARTGMDDAELLDFIEHQRVEQVKAQVDKKQAEAAELDAFLSSDEALLGLHHYNACFGYGFLTWRDADRARGQYWSVPIRQVVLNWRNLAIEAAENAKLTAQEDERYRDKRRIDWLQEFTGATAVSWKNTTPLSQKAIDRLIDGEISSK